MTRLDRFLTVDYKERDHSSALSAIVGLGCFIAARALLGFSESAAGYATLATVFCVYLIRMWSYRPAWRSQATHVGSRRAFVGFAPVWSAAAAALVIFINRIASNPLIVHAATIAARNAIEQKQPVSETEMSRIASLTKHLINTAQNPVVRSRLLTDYATTKAAVTYSQLQKEGRLDHGSPHPSNGPVMFAFKGHNLVWRVSISTETQGARLADLDCIEPCKVMFAYNEISGFQQALDGITWFHTTFKRCTLSYSGGSLALVEVSMEGCTVDVSERVPLVIKQALERVAAEDGIITISSDFPRIASISQRVAR
jgi:hypothetical protein